MRFPATTLAACAASLLLAYAPAAGQTVSPGPDPVGARFGGLWTSWGGTSRESLRTEVEAGRRAAGGVAASAEGERSRVAAMALGERVGEIVRLGDCEEGERVARAAGDFALVRAVRDHCRRAGATSG